MDDRRVSRDKCFFMPHPFLPTHPMKKPCQLQTLCPLFYVSSALLCSSAAFPPTHPPGRTALSVMNRDRHAPGGARMGAEELRELQYLRDLHDQMTRRDYAPDPLMSRGRDPRGPDPRDDRFPDRFSDRYDRRDLREERFNDRFGRDARDDRPDSRDRFGDRFDRPGPAFRDIRDAPSGYRDGPVLPDYRERRQLSPERGFFNPRDVRRDPRGGNFRDGPGPRGPRDGARDDGRGDPRDRQGGRDPRDSMPGDGPGPRGPRDVRQTRDDRNRDFDRKDNGKRTQAQAQITADGNPIPTVMPSLTRDDYTQEQRHENDVGRFFEENSKDYVQVFYILPTNIGKLVGTRGSQIHLMERKFSVVLNANATGRVVVRARRMENVESCSIEVRRVTSLWAEFDKTDTWLEVTDQVMMDLQRNSCRYMYDISRDTDCKLDVARRRNGSVVRIIGTPEARKAGLAAIKKFVRKSDTNINETYMFPLDALARFIGQRGRHVASFEKDTECAVNSRKAQVERVGDLGPLVLTGPPEVIARAKERIHELLTEWGHDIPAQSGSKNNANAKEATEALAVTRLEKDTDMINAEEAKRVLRYSYLRHIVHAEKWEDPSAEALKKCSEIITHIEELMVAAGYKPFRMRMVGEWMLGVAEKETPVKMVVVQSKQVREMSPAVQTEIYSKLQEVLAKDGFTSVDIAGLYKNIFLRRRGGDVTAASLNAQFNFDISCNTAHEQQLCALLQAYALQSPVVRAMMWVLSSFFKSLPLAVCSTKVKAALNFETIGVMVIRFLLDCSEIAWIDPATAREKRPSECEWGPMHKMAQYSSQVQAFMKFYTFGFDFETHQVSITQAQSSERSTTEEKKNSVSVCNPFAPNENLAPLRGKEFSDFLLLMYTVSALDEETETDEEALAKLHVEHTMLQAVARARLDVAGEETTQRGACEKEEGNAFSLIAAGDDDMVVMADAEDDEDSEHTSCDFVNNGQPDVEAPETATQETGPLPDDDDDDDSYMH